MGSDRGENYNFSKGQEINHEAEMKVRSTIRSEVSPSLTCTQVLKVP